MPDSSYQFIDLHCDEYYHTVTQNKRPFQGAHWFTAENVIKNRDISIGYLKNGHYEYTNPKELVGENTQNPEGLGYGSAIEKVEHFSKNKNVDGQSPCQFFVASTQSNT